MKDYIHVVREFDRKRRRNYIMQETIGAIVLFVAVVFVLSIPFDKVETLFLWTK